MADLIPVRCVGGILDGEIRMIPDGSVELRWVSDESLELRCATPDPEPVVEVTTGIADSRYLVKEITGPTGVPHRLLVAERLTLDEAIARLLLGYNGVRR